MTQLIKKRFISSFLGNIFRSVISFATGMLVARWLGVEDYGRMTFLLASFTAVRGIFDMGTSTAFFTLLSQRSRSLSFVKKFWIWVAFQLIISLCMVGLLLPDNLLQVIWKNNDRSILILALLASFMQGQAWNLASQMAEASRNTIRLQKLNTVLVLVNLLIIVLLWANDQLALPFIFLVTALEWGIASYLAAAMYKHSEVAGISEVQSETAKSVFKEFWVFCSPLMFYSWLSFVYEFADRWMLQTWGGNIQQAFFGIAQQFAAIALLATTSILRIFWKEVAEGHHAGKGEEVTTLYIKISKILYFIGAMFAGALLPWSSEILEIIVGKEYVGGATTLMLLLLYPVHQSLGQINGTMAYATSNVSLQVRVGTIFIILSLIFTYFLLAPKSLFLSGLGLGSEGLAMKMVILQIISVNVLGWYLSKALKIRFEWLYQAVVLTVCIILGWFSFKIVNMLFNEVFTIYIRIFLSFSAFLASVIIYLYLFPSTAGIKRLEMVEFLRSCLLPFVKKSKV